MSTRFNISFLYTLVLILSLLGSGMLVSQVQGGQTSSPQSMTVEATTEWTNQALTLSETEVVGSGDTLTITNSIIQFQNTSLSHGIVVDGGQLMITDSIISFDGIDHAVYGITSGSITYDNATLSSNNGDATHLEGNYQIQITDSIFKDTGDDGLHIAQNSNPIVVENSLFHNIGDDGFDLLEVDTAELVNSKLEMVRGHAIKIISSGNITLRDLYLDGTGATPEDDNRGMDIEDSEKVVVENATIQNFPSDGIKVQRTPFEGYDVFIEDVGDEGIEFENTIADNPVTLDGFTIINAYGGDAIKVEFVQGKVLINNTYVDRGGDDGIQITQGNTTTEILNTHVSKAKEDGFELDSSVTMMMQNVTAVANTENGIKFKTIGNVTIIGSNFSDNGFNGISSGNATSLHIRDTIVSSNLEGGIINQGSKSFTLQSSVVEDNRRTNVRAPGVVLGGTTDFTLEDNSIESNSGSGILIDSSNGTLHANSISYNEVDGIGISGTSQVDILDNTISSNGQNGLSIVNGSNGLIVNNTFTSNANYGVFSQTTGTPVNISGNYWGSNSGPIWQNVGEDGRDGVFGNVVLSTYLGDEGDTYQFEPPLEVDFQFLFFAILGVLAVLAVAGFVIYRIQLVRWKNKTEPLALIYVNHIGLPLLEYHFKDGSMDPALVSGFLSAVSSFGSEIYKREGPGAKEKNKIREIQSKENVIILYIVGKSMLALIVVESNPAIRGSLEKFGDKMVMEAEYEKGEDIDDKVANYPVDRFEHLVVSQFKDFMST